MPTKLNGKKTRLSNLVLPRRYVEHVQSRLALHGKKVYSPSTIHKTRTDCFALPNPDIANALIEFSKEYAQMLSPNPQSPQCPHSPKNP